MLQQGAFCNRDSRQGQHFDHQTHLKLPLAGGLQLVQQVLYEDVVCRQVSKDEAYSCPASADAVIWFLIAICKSPRPQADLTANSAFTAKDGG